jgi:transcription termination factor Rho
VGGKETEGNGYGGRDRGSYIEGENEGKRQSGVDLGNKTKRNRQERRERKEREQGGGERGGEEGKGEGGERGRERGGRGGGVGKQGGKVGVKEGGRGRDEKERGRRRGGSCGLHVFKGTLVQDFCIQLFL